MLNPAAGFRHIATSRTVNIDDYNTQNSEWSPLPYLIAVIYEISDVMAAQPQKAEELINGLTAKGSQVGIHLVIATQRPEPNTLTDRLRASFPTRICFNVVFREDSVVALGMTGAEKLPENDEMLLLNSKISTPQHIIGHSFSYEEIDDLIREAKQS